MSRFSSIITENTIFEAALAWLKRGCSLLPCQPNSKYFLQGFGPVKRTIRDRDQAERYFGRQQYNLAVVLPASLYALDFDDWHLYTTWSESVQADLQLTHTEITPRGAHVFYRGEIPPVQQLVEGVEIKRACLVAPSVVAGRRYVDLGFQGILEIPDYKALIFSLLSKTDSASVLDHRQPESPVGVAESDLIAHIKTSWPIFETASHLTKLEPSPHGQARWYRGRCPLHSPDNHPSFWLDRQRGTWGCFSCTPKGGDVINLVAKFSNLTVQQAIKVLARREPRG